MLITNIGREYACTIVEIVFLLLTSKSLQLAKLDKTYHNKLVNFIDTCKRNGNEAQAKNAELLVRTSKKKKKDLLY